MVNNKRRILILHGTNLNLLGKRETNIYGVMTLEEINLRLKQRAELLNLDIEIVQSNHEGVMVDTIHMALGKFDGVIINPAAFTHYSIAIRDALGALSVPIIEVHLSNIYRREEFRQHSVIAPVATGQIAGLGAIGYLLALDAMSEITGGNNQ